MLKKALLVGINDYTKFPLRGCINDIMDMREALTEFFSYKAEDIKILQNREATKQGIIDGLRWLAEGGAGPAVRVFHYAGHGDFELDIDGDEKDKTDEALAPYDYLTNGLLLDDELRKLYETFPPNSNLTLVMDSCFSGTVQRDLENDIVYRFLPAPQEKIDAVIEAQEEAEKNFLRQELRDVRNAPDDMFNQRLERALDKYKKQFLFGGDSDVRQGNVLLAACRSDQRAADASIENKYHGAFTFYLVKVLRKYRGQISHDALIKAIGDEMKRFKQVPQLECDAGKGQVNLFSAFNA